MLVLSIILVICGLWIAGVGLRDFFVASLAYAFAPLMAGAVHGAMFGAATTSLAEAGEIVNSLEQGLVKDQQKAAMFFLGGAGLFLLGVISLLVQLVSALF